MGKVFGLHEVRLREGVTGEELEAFIRQEASQTPFLSGWEGYLLRRRGDSGADGYLLVWAIDEERYPGEHPEVLAEYARWRRDHAQLWARWADVMATAEEDILIGDYVIAARL